MIAIYIILALVTLAVLAVPAAFIAEALDNRKEQAAWRAGYADRMAYYNKYRGL